VIDTLAGIAPKDLRGKRIVITRFGAFGDSVIITPVIRHLASMGAEVWVHTSERGLQILNRNPHIHHFVTHVTDSVPLDKMDDYMATIKIGTKADYLIDMSGSLEQSLSPNAFDPHYNWPVAERTARCDRNYYEHSFEYIGLKAPKSPEALRGELFFSQREHREMKDWLAQNTAPGEKLMLVCWSGSGLNKQYPFMEHVVGEMLTRHPNLAVVIVGDLPVGPKDLSEQSGGRVCSRIGHWSFRQSALATYYADVVLTPDTGILHAAGCYKTPKVGVIGHNTLNNLTKHFVNDFSVAADRDLVPCAPCHKVIQSPKKQCPIALIPCGDGTFAESAWCMRFGLDPARVVSRLEEALGASDRLPARRDAGRVAAPALRQAG
jgi:ADP-heptose:LPS heptosyltransferase